MELRFCYRIAKEAKLAYNLETGEDEEAFAQIKLELLNTPSNYDKLHREIGYILARRNRCDPQWVNPISTEEYDQHNQEDDEP